MLAEARCGGFVCAHRHGKVELVVHGLDSHHWLLDTEPLLGVRVGGWHLLVRYQLEAFQVPSSKHAQRKQSSSQPTAYSPFFGCLAPLRLKNNNRKGNN